MAQVFSDICSEGRGVPADVLEKVLYLAVEIAREGREGKKLARYLPLVIVKTL